MASSGFLHPPKSPPNLNIPSGSTVKVSIIDCTADIQVPIAVFMAPEQPGHEFLRAPAYSFLIEHHSRKILFDLGVRKDWQNSSPTIRSMLSQPGVKVDVKQGVAEILQENGIDVAGGVIEDMIWSHWHFDHVGDPSTFPGSTTLVVGSGVKEAFLPAYPSNPESPLLESDFAGRDLNIIDFESSALKIGGFRAIDYFDDGSFYLLDSPGHAIGHMCGLARVTNEGEDSFIFMGGDTAHHGGEFRPTEYLPLPAGIQPSPHTGYHGVCPGHIFEAIHPGKKGNSPYYHLTEGLPSDIGQAEESVRTMEEFDAAENVFVIIAHDSSLLHPEVGMEWFPHGTLRDWKEKDLARKARWGFLRDFEVAVGKQSEH